MNNKTSVSVFSRQAQISYQRYYGEEHQNFARRKCGFLFQGKRRGAPSGDGFCEIRRGPVVRLNGGRGTEPLNPWWQEIRLHNCKPVYRNHTHACAGI
jgi:hypothetical protein